MLHGWNLVRIRLSETQLSLYLAAVRRVLGVWASPEFQSKCTAPESAAAIQGARQ
jgi:hypothetical protein